MKLSKILTSAVITGLVAGATAFAQDGVKNQSSDTQMSGEKNSCQGKKNSCKGMAGRRVKKKKEKNSCSGKNGCGEKRKSESKE